MATIPEHHLSFIRNINYINKALKSFECVFTSAHLVKPKVNGLGGEFKEWTDEIRRNIHPHNQFFSTLSTNDGVTEHPLLDKLGTEKIHQCLISLRSMGKKICRGGETTAINIHIDVPLYKSFNKHLKAGSRRQIKSVGVETKYWFWWLGWRRYIL